MKIKKYQAPTMREALSKVKGDLGSDAVILQTRTYRSSAFLGIGGKEVVEITASLDPPPPARTPSSGQLYNRHGRSMQAGGPVEPRLPDLTGQPIAVSEQEKEALGFLTGVVAPPPPKTEHAAATPPAKSVAPAPPPVAPTPPPVAPPVAAEPPKTPEVNRIKAPTPPADSITVINKVEGLDALEKEIVRVKSMVHNLLGKDRNRTIADLPYPLMKAYHQLIESGVEELTARSLAVRLHRDMDATEARDPEKVAEALKKSVRGLVRVAGPIRFEEGMPRRIALIGPTGVGKTTTIAKLAAAFKLRDHLEVGLITVDTYRIAAVEQLKVYADIIGVPLNVVLAPHELPGAVEAFADKDIILIDTAGRSQMDEAKMTELRGFLDTAPPHETHLVISASTHPKNVASIVERFGPLASDKVIITKVDEVMQPGTLLNMITKAEKAISYMTVGQEVPDDIEVAQADALTDRILGGISW